MFGYGYSNGQLASAAPILSFTQYLRYNERTGEPMRVNVPSHDTLDPRFFTKKGLPRKSVLFKSKRYYSF